MLFLSVITAALVINCGGVPDILSTPIENIDNTPIKEQELTEKEKQNWGHLDLVKDTIPGMSVEKAYAEILSGRSGQQVIVAIIDSGIDIDHEDLDGVIWRNSDEIAGNNKDDDRNGYVDDINGW
ncbi:MAG: peptidase S8, partial [Flavobacteriaceae bacterium]|nr:peptidase S8 [Flavobacteriaceae bacterium]